MNTVIAKIAQAFEASLKEGGPITPPEQIEEFNALDLVSQKILIHKFERYLRYLAKGLGTFTLATTTIEDVQHVSRAISIYSLKFPEMNDGELSEERIRELMHQRQLEHNKQWAELMALEVPIRRQQQDLDDEQVPDLAGRVDSDVKFASVFDPPTSLLTGKVPAPEHVYGTVPLTDEQVKRLQDLATRNAAIWVDSEENIEEMVERWHKTMKAAIENGDKGIIIDPCAPIVSETESSTTLRTQVTRRGRVDGGSQEDRRAPVKSVEDKAEVDDGTTLHKFDVRYYEQGARQIPANRRRAFIWAEGIEGAADKFATLEPNAVDVLIFST